MQRFVRLLTVGLSVGLLAATAHGAAAPAAAVTVTPDAVALAAGEAARVVVTVEAGGAALTDVTLRPAGLAGLTLSPAEPPPWPRIEAGGSRSLVIEVRRSDDGGAVGTVPLLVSWTQPPAEGGGDTAAAKTKHGARAATLTVTDSTARLMSGVAELVVQSGIAKIEDRRGGGVAYVVVTNKTSHPLRVTGVRCYAPYFLALRAGRGERPDTGLWIAGAVSRLWRALRGPKTAGNGGDGAPDAPGATDDPAACAAGLTLPTLAPGSSAALPFQITASVVEPGTHTVAWEVDLEWRRAGEAQRGSLVVSKDFTVGVLGESELLKLFTWPSVLVLPGALMLLTVLTLRKRVWPKTASDLSSTAEATKAEFWLVAVVLSFLTAILYPWVTGQLGDPRDFIVVHGLDDVVNLWLGSVAVALLAWALWYGGKLIVKRTANWLADSWQNYQDQLRLPQPTDSPLKLLAKLDRAGRHDLNVAVGTVTAGGATQAALLLFDAKEEGRWVGPPALVICRSVELVDALEPLRDDVSALRTAVDEQVGAGGARVQWKHEGTMPHGPERLAADAQWTPSGGHRRLVELEVGTV